MLFELSIIAFLLALNAFFALSEMAIVSASKPLLQEHARQGSRAAAVAIRLKNNPGRFLSTVQVGITLVGVLAGAFGGASLGERLGAYLNEVQLISTHGEAIAVVIVVSCITYFSVVFGELVPKQAALNNAEPLAMRVAPLMAVLSYLCTPIVIILENSAKLLMRLFGIKMTDKGVTESEIRAVIAEGVVTGAIKEDEHDLMRRVIRLGDRDVKSIMTHRTNVNFISMNDSLAQIRDKILAAGHSSYPVIDGDKSHVLGIVKTKEMLARASSDTDFKVINYLSEMCFVNESLSCLDALGKFRNESIHIAGVIDEYGTFEGLFTTSDLLEAIVGVIPSNYHNDDAPHIVQREDGSWLLDGLTPIDEIHMTIGIDTIPLDADYETLAGFLLNELKIKPATGAVAKYGTYRFEIVDMDGLRIDKILMSHMPDPKVTTK